MCNCHSILECCVTVSGVKLSIRSFALFLPVKYVKLSRQSKAYSVVRKRVPERI